MFFSEKVTHIKEGDRVLEVGPGGIPHPRSDVFLDLDPSFFPDEETALFQRGAANELITEKPIVYYDGREFPFNNDEFDYVICSHVLEHVEDVDYFLSELSRVAKRGYIEYPTIYYDYVYNIPVHLNFLKFNGGNIINWMKKADSPLSFFSGVQALFFQSTFRGYTQLIDDLKIYMIEGFEWEDSIKGRGTSLLEDLVCKNISISQRLGEGVSNPPSLKEKFNSMAAHKSPIKAFASKAMIKAGAILNRRGSELAPKIQDIQAERVKPWLDVNGDQTLRMDYPLNNNSVVFDLGGYEGQWASDIYSRYRCKIYIFEPVPQFAKEIKQRFLKNPDIHVQDFGLSDKDGKIKLSMEANATSAYKESDDSVEVELRKANHFIKEKNIESIDLIKINIEGGEYDLLDHLLSEGLVRNIQNLQIQFHDFVPDAETRMNHIQDQLKKTHELTYQFPFVWENWRLKQ
jgi:FkbM family methyltransferase